MTLCEKLALLATFLSGEIFRCKLDSCLPRTEICEAESTRKPAKIALSIANDAICRVVNLQRQNVMSHPPILYLATLEFAASNQHIPPTNDWLTYERLTAWDHIARAHDWIDRPAS